MTSFRFDEFQADSIVAISTQEKKNPRHLQTSFFWPSVDFKKKFYKNGFQTQVCLEKNWFIFAANKKNYSNTDIKRTRKKYDTS